MVMLTRLEIEMIEIVHLVNASILGTILCLGIVKIRIVSLFPQQKLSTLLLEVFAHIDRTRAMDGGF